MYCMKERILQLDYLKGVFILLMVTFHLTLIEQTYPTLRSAVYTFHMAAFLIISGYLANIEKGGKAFGSGMLRLLVPYVIFEAVYILMIYFLGQVMHANHSIEELSVLSFIDRIVEHPSGPYWYLHTLVICTVVYYLVFKVIRLKALSGIILTGLILFGLTFAVAKLNWENVIYFLIGVYITRCGKAFMEMIPPSLLAILPLCVLFSSNDNFHRDSLAGITITVLMISLLLYLYSYCPDIIRRGLVYLGRNSLAIVIFSPIFTVFTKMLVPYFCFDTTAISFGIFALVFVTACCLLCAWICDKLHISKYIFRKDSFYVNFA